MAGFCLGFWSEVLVAGERPLCGFARTMGAETPAMGSGILVAKSREIGERRVLGFFH